MKNRYLRNVGKFGLAFLALLLSTQLSRAQLTGTKTIPTDYASIAAFVTDLNAQGVGPGGVTLDIPSGYTETAPAGGYSITTLTGSATNQIIIRGIGGAPKPIITASGGLTSGNLNDAIIKIIGTDYVTIAGLDLRENAANTTTTAATNNMTEWGIALLYSTATDNSQNITLQNNSIALVRTYQNTFGIYANATHTALAPTTGATATGANGGNHGLKVYGNTISNVNQGILVVGPTAVADQNNGIDIGGLIAANGNTITNYGSTGTFSGYANVSGSVNGIVVRNSINLNVQNNTITSSVGGTTGGTLRGIFLQAFSNAPTAAFTTNVSNNSISVQSGVSSAIVALHVDATTSSSTSTYNVQNNTFSNIGHTIAATSNVTCIQNATVNGTVNITGNNFNALTVNTTGTLYLINNNCSLNNFTISGNYTTGTINKTGAGGTLYGYYNFGSPTGGTATLTNNNFSNLTVTGATSLYGIRQYTATAQIEIINNNIISNLTGGTSNIFGIVHGYGAPGGEVTGNQVFNMTGGAQVTGIQLGDGSAGNVNCYNNQVHDLTSTGASAVNGILNTAAIANNIYRNKIYALSNSNAGGTVNGILVLDGAAVKVHNNLISDLTAPIASGNDVIRGISMTGTTATTSIGVYYNTVLLNASSTGTNFGTSGIFHNANATATTAALDLRNNIILNTSTPNGTGISVAFRRSGTALNNLVSTSNRNLFYAGNPGASRLIMYDGTTSHQTITAYQMAVTPREANSFTGEAAFTGSGYATAGNFFISLTGSSSDFLRPVDGITTQVEAGASSIAAITTDYTGAARPGTPDLGAYEFAGTSPAPQITLNSVTPPTTMQCTAVARLVSVNITTPSGTIVGATIGYTVNGVPQTNIVMTNTTGSTWEGTIPVPTPPNATIAWAVAASNSIGVNNSYTGTPYADEPLFGRTASAVASSSTVCSGSPTTLTALLNNPEASTLYNTPSIANPVTDEDLRTVRITQGATTLLNNTSTINTLNGTIGTPTGTAGSYSNYTAFTPTTLTGGQTYSLFVASIDAPSYYTNYATAFIDFNRDGDFADAGESLIPSTGVTLNAATDNGNDSITVSFTVPASAINGLTRMRVSITETGQTNATGSLNNSYGEFEDYSIMITGGTAGTTTNITSVTWMDGATTVGTGNPLVANPTVTTTYTANIVSAGCSFAPSPTTTVTVNPLPSAVTATNSAQCGTQIPTAFVTSTTGAPTPTFNWYSASTGGTLLQSSTSTTYTSVISTTTTFYVSEVNGTTGCESPRTAVTVNVSTPDPVSASASVPSVCENGSVTLTAANTNPTPFQSYTYSWGSTAGSGAATPIAGSPAVVTPTVAGTYVYTVTATDGGCVTTNTVSVVVNPNPSSIVASASDVNICAGEQVNLSVTSTTGSPISPTTILAQNFDAGLGTWTTTYSGTAPAASGWVSQNAPYSYTTYFTNFATPQGGGFAMSNGDIGGSGLKTRAALISPTFSTVGMTSATLTFQNLYQKWNSGDSLVRLEISTNGGTSWATLKDYLPLGSQGNVTSGSQVPANESIVLGAPYLNQANLKIRYNYVTAWGYYWVVDDVKVIGTPVDPTTYAWTSTPSGFTSSVQNPTGVAPTVTTNYTVNLTNSFGCSASGSVNVVVNQPSSSSLSATACDSYTWAQNGTTYTTSGAYTAVIPNAAGCDSTITLNLTIKNSTTSSTSVTACSSYTWTNGTTYNTSGTYTQTLVNSVGCDSIATLVLTINQPTTSTITAAACNSYTLNATTYTSSGTYTQLLAGANANGCDSTITLNLTINQPTTGTDVQSACGSYTWIDGITYTASNNTATYTIVGGNANGCDSIVTLNLTINQPTSSTVTAAACGSYTWAENATTYTTSGSYQVVLAGANSVGCDSTITLNLTINQPTSSTVTATACGSYTWSENAMIYTTSGSYQVVLAGANSVGCDSTITLNLTINQPTSSTVAATACDSYTWAENGSTYTTSGSYQVVLAGANSVGCDSTITLNLTINNSVTGTDVQSACGSYTWINGNTYTTSNNTATFTIVGGAATGCDSIVTLNLTINALPTATATDNGDATITASAGNGYQWINCTTGAAISGANAQTFAPTANGSYAVVVSNASGCVDTSACVTINNVSIKEATAANIAVFPNPTHNNVTITMTAATAKVEVVDAQGKLLQTIEVTNGGKVDLSTYETGVYFLRIQTENGSTLERVVKN